MTVSNRQIDPRDQDAFDELQAKLVPLWSSLDHLNTDEQTIVVVPSADVDIELTASQLQAYEERFLFLLFLLRQPRARMIFVTGQTIAPEIVDYYMDLLPGVIQSNARRRLFFISPMEARFRPLSRKLLDRPLLLEEISSLIVDEDRAHLVPFMTTWDDRELAMRLGIPMYGCDPALVSLGTKSSGRAIFAEAGVAHARGKEDLRSRDDVVAGIREILVAAPDVSRVIVKLNEGVSGFGNAVLDVADLSADDDVERIRERIGSLQVDEIMGDVSGFLAHLEKEGGVVEEMIESDSLRSPSVQLRITPLGDVELLSTHDQILGGSSGQTFLGSRFPADPAYASQISRSASRVGEILAARGVIGRFAIDYLVQQRDDGSWEEHAVEVNLRKGGTTHPFLTLQFLTDGDYDAEAGVFTAPDGIEKHYVASDHLEIRGLEVFRPQDLLDRVLMADLHFDQSVLKGVVFHMLSAMPTHGFVGVTCIGDTAEEAETSYAKVIEFLTEQAERFGPGTPGSES